MGLIDNVENEIVRNSVLIKLLIKRRERDGLKQKDNKRGTGINLENEIEEIGEK